MEEKDLVNIIAVSTIVMGLHLKEHHKFSEKDAQKFCASVAVFLHKMVKTGDWEKRLMETVYKNLDIKL